MKSRFNLSEIWTESGKVYCKQAIRRTKDFANWLATQSILASNFGPRTVISSSDGIRRLLQSQCSTAIYFIDLETMKDEIEPDRIF